MRQVAFAGGISLLTVLALAGCGGVTGTTADSGRSAASASTTAPAASNDLSSAVAGAKSTLNDIKTRNADLLVDLNPFIQVDDKPTAVKRLQESFAFNQSKITEAKWEGDGGTHGDYTLEEVRFVIDGKQFDRGWQMMQQSNGWVAGNSGLSSATNVISQMVGDADEPGMVYLVNGNKRMEFASAQRSWDSNSEKRPLEGIDLLPGKYTFEIVWADKSKPTQTKTAFLEPLLY